MTRSPAVFPGRESIADNLDALGEAERAFVRLVFENPLQDEAFFEGLQLYLERASSAPFLNSLKLGKCGEWLGESAPARLQIRLMEIARSSQHAAYAAFREGLSRSGGLEKAYPKAKI